MNKKLALVPLVFLLLAFSASAEQLVSLDDLIVYFDFDNATGYAFEDTIYDLGGNYDAYVGTGISQGTGKLGSSINCDNSGTMVGLPSGMFSGKIDGNSDYTVTFWINPDTASEDTIITAEDDISWNVLITATGIQVNTKQGSSWGVRHSRTFDPDGKWTFVALRYNASSGYDFTLNNSFEAPGQGTQATYASSATKSKIGTNGGESLDFDGDIDELGIWNRYLSNEELTNLYNSTYALKWDFQSGEVPPVAPNISNFTIQARDIFNGTYLTNFKALVDGRVYQSNATGFIITHLLENATHFYNLTINSTQAGGYYSKKYINYNVSNDLVANLTKLYRLYYTTYKGNLTNGTIQFTKRLNYTLSLTCPSFSNTTIYTIINKKNVTQEHIPCNNATYIYSQAYTPINESFFNISFTLNASIAGNDQRTKQSKFKPDLYAPSVKYLNFTYINGFGAKTATTYAICTDTAYTQLYYNVTWNGNTLFKGIRNNNTLVQNSTFLVNGNNTLNVICSDLFYNSTSTIFGFVYVKQFILIDEITRTPFDITNLSIVKVYFEDNQTQFDFKANNTAAVNFTSGTNDKLRFELGYYDGGTINRYISLELIGNDTRICANKDDITHYQILLTSATPKAAVLKNIYANCLVAGDYTRFAYQDGVLLQAHTINSVYGLYTYDGSERVYLASVDGSLAIDIDIGTLIFKQTAYDFDLLKDNLAIQKNGSSQVIIYYYNPKGDNTALDLTITRLDTSDIVYTETDFSDTNEFTLYFNWAALLNVTNSTTFKISLIKTTADGTQTTLSQYFNTQGGTGILNAVMAAVISFILVLVGFTLVSSRTALGWFGFIIYSAGIAVLAFSPLAWYSILLMAIYIISLIFLAVNSGLKGYVGAT